MDRESELALVARLRSGDPEAFDAVHQAFNARLFTFLARLTQRRDLAEDLLEETWLRAVTHTAALAPDTRLAPWLFTVARNLYASYCRARAVETSHAAKLIGLWPDARHRPSPFELLAASETERRLEAALASMPVASREALLLAIVDELSPKDAAVVCGVSAEAMRKRLSRARHLLHERLNAQGRTSAATLKEVET